MVASSSVFSMTDQGVSHLLSHLLASFQLRIPCACSCGCSWLQLDPLRLSRGLLLLPVAVLAG